MVRHGHVLERTARLILLAALALPAWARLTCEGNGPTVVFEAEDGRNPGSLRNAARSLSQFARACVHQRSTDEPSTYVPLLDRELAGVGSVILVAEGRAGYLVRNFAARYPRRIVAVVLIDPANEEFLDRMRPYVPCTEYHKIVQIERRFIGASWVPRQQANALTVLTSNNYPFPEGWAREPLQRLWEESHAALARSSFDGVHQVVPGTVLEHTQDIVRAIRARLPATRTQI